MKKQIVLIKNSMIKKDKNILIKAEKTLTSCKNEDSIYIKELRQSYKEYKSLKTIDKTTNDLYIEHINKLCELIKIKHNANKSLVLMIIVFMVMFIMTTFSTYKYYDISKNLKNNIIKNNKISSLIVEYESLNNFNALSLSDISEYQDLIPLTLSVEAKTKDNSNRKMHYNVYIIEKNDGIKKDNIISRDYFLFNVKTNDKDSGIKYLDKATISNGKLLLFSKDIYSDEKDNIEIRMWIDKNKKQNFLNKRYNFTIYVDGYEV